MTTSRTLRLLVTLTTVTSLATPSSVLGGEQLPNSPVVQPAHPTALAPLDIALSDDGQLMGAVFDEEGAALAGAAVYLFAEDGSNCGTTSCDSQGHFQLNVDQGGIYQLVADNNSTVLRCWVNETAPPTARQQVILTTGDLQRGQIHPAVSGFGNPWVITGIVVAAVAIPIALHNNRSDRPNSSN